MFIWCPHISLHWFSGHMTLCLLYWSIHIDASSLVYVSQNQILGKNQKCTSIFHTKLLYLPSFTLSTCLKQGMNEEGMMSLNLMVVSQQKSVFFYPRSPLKVQESSFCEMFQHISHHVDDAIWLPFCAVMKWCSLVRISLIVCFIQSWQATFMHHLQWI